MTREEYAAIAEIQTEAGQLATLLSLVGRAADDGMMTDAFEACASLAHRIADAIDSVPGFIDAQRNASAHSGAAA